MGRSRAHYSGPECPVRVAGTVANAGRGSILKGKIQEETQINLKSSHSDGNIRGTERDRG